MAGGLLASWTRAVFLLDQVRKLIQEADRRVRRDAEVRVAAFTLGGSMNG